MIRIKESLKKLLVEFQIIGDELERQSAQLPKGSLIIKQNNDRVQFFQRNTGGKKPTSIYLPKSKEDYVRQLAQHSYVSRLSRLVRRRIRQVKALLEGFEDDEIDRIYEQFTPLRRSLIRPVRPTWNMRVREWMSEKYEGKPFYENEQVIMTSRGERVRSKSERMIANELYRYGIPYKYERPIRLPNSNSVYPDFTILSPRTGTEVIWEHFGRMSDPEYMAKTYSKQKMYSRLHFLPGINFIATYEDSRDVLSSSEVDEIIHRLLLP